MDCNNALSIVLFGVDITALVILTAGVACGWTLMTLYDRWYVSRVRERFAKESRLKSKRR